MRDTLLTYESKSMEKEREQIGGPISECMKPYWQITINRQNVINVSDWKATFRVYIRHLMGFQHKKRVFTCSEVHLPQDTQLLCPERLFPSGAPVWPGVGLGGASLQPQSLYQGNTFSGPEHNTGATHRYKRERTWCYFSLIFFFLMASHWIWLAEHVQDPCCVGK